MLCYFDDLLYYNMSFKFAGAPSFIDGCNKVYLSWFLNSPILSSSARHKWSLRVDACIVIP